MAYIGTPPQSGFITTAKQRVTGSTNNYVDLDNSISSLADVIVWVNSVKQDSTNLSLTTSTRITLGGTLTASDVVEIAYLGKAVATQTPDTGTVTNDMLSGSIANSKLANSSITLNGSAVSLGGSASISGTHVLIDEETTTSASTLTVTGMDSTYKTYMMDIIDLNTSADADLQMRYVTSSGALTTNDYQYAGTGYNSNAGGSNWSHNGTDNIKLLGETIRHDSGMSNALRLFISNPSGTSNQKRCFWMGGGNRTGNYTFSSQGSSNYYGSTSAVTGLQVYPSSGTYDNVTIKLYGVK